MSVSILTSIKLSLGVPETHTAFDSEILMHLNSALATLTQLGVGPEEGFFVESTMATWADFIGSDPRYNSVKSYLNLRVKLLFDPPEVGFVLTSMKEQIKELEWRLNAQREDDAQIAKETPTPITP